MRSIGLYHVICLGVNNTDISEILTDPILVYLFTFDAHTCFSRTDRPI